MLHTLPDARHSPTTLIRLAYDTFGARTNVPLFLIMDLGAQRIFWEDGFCQLLAERGFWVIRR